MAKTIVELEPSDIDSRGNPMHKAALVAVMIGAVALMSKNKDGESKEEAATRITATAVAALLNSLLRDGYAITKTETIPAAFYNA